MTKRFALLFASATCLATAACLSGLFARDQAPSNWKSLEIRCAQANVALAQARLAQAESENKLAAGTISQETIALLRTAVRLTQDRLQQLEGKNDAAPYAPQIMATIQLVKDLQTAHNESLEANKLQFGAVSVPRLRREEAEINMAQARLAALQSLAQQPLEVRLEWQISQLQDDIHSLWARPLIEE